MSISEINVYLAVEAPISTFFVDTGKEKIVCSGDGQHEVRETANFCEHCGSPIKRVPIKEPAPALKAFCDKEGVTPVQAFFHLEEEGWEWSDVEGETSYTLRWLEVQLRSCSKEKIRALGFCLETIDAIPSQDKRNVVSYSLDDFPFKLKEALREVAESFELEAEPKLYLQVLYDE